MPIIFEKYLAGWVSRTRRLWPCRAHMRWDVVTLIEVALTGTLSWATVSLP